MALGGFRGPTSRRCWRWRGRPSTCEAVEHLAELAYLERGIGRPGLLALHPPLPTRRKALRQMLAL